MNPSDQHIRISLPAQTLELISNDGTLVRRYPVSTAKNGAGEMRGSYCTPTGHHIVRAKIGDGMPIRTVFVGRRPTGEIWTPELHASEPGRDWMLTRILWLSGTERGINRLGRVDTMRRYIYIHGSADTAVMGIPGSHGCIRMHNEDVLELFDLVDAGTPVNIVQFSVEDSNWSELQSSAKPVREAVFVQEQQVPRDMEWDGHDAPSRHVIARNAAGFPIGTGRLLPDGHIGRMAVLPDWRHHDVGSAIFERLLQLAKANRMSKLELHAQVHAEGFYTRYGFAVEGPQFMEAGIRHVRMTRTL
ncbi:MAG TPA: GNAT family N-acetyltransferase [Rhodocyclaceae bacterium]|jgi:predicted GNAT family N-acyltransferase|nr:GNAT family N-acetyltransferase [Rhodocyclaceae bacterium]